MLDFKKYIKELQSVSIDELTEHSKRFALETLFREVADMIISKNQIKILHEPKRKDNYGSPDFKIYTDNSIIGYVENKKISANLDRVLKSEQIKKYKELSSNILLTNYIEFIWIKDGNIKRETLCYASDLENKKFKIEKNKIENIENILISFFSIAPVGIASAKELAFALAIRSKNLKNFLFDDLKNQDTDEEKSLLSGLYETFKSHIFNELTISEFADAFAQMLVYGLFLAKLNADTKEVTLYNAKRYIPQSFELIRELVGFLDELENENYKDTRWIIDETISIMNNLDLLELKKSLLFSKKVKDKDNIETDPYIYFYETFLAAYDSKLRKAKGVYYTPPQIVNFIVRSLNQILTNTFKIEKGFAQSEKVTVLDFATGTGTFLIEILKQIFETIPSNNKSLKNMLIKEHILKNIYGFEYLIAPYTVAHLKLSQFLKENDYVLENKERFQLFLTNTLEPIADIPPNLYTKALSAEGKLAQKIKDKPILVITGNPPYSGHSKNTGDWITNLLKGNDIWSTSKIEKQANYFKVDGKPLGEKNPKWLQDDYVKFIRFAQYKIDHAGQGIVGIITNHSFLDNPTFRGMRQSLMQSFDQLYFIDLHGNSKKKEKTPDGKPDKNVFDIQQGVAISIFVKKKGLKKGVFHTDFWGTRKNKFDLCINNSIETLYFRGIKPQKPFYLFVPQDEELRKSYNSFFHIKNIFKENSLGVLTHRDKFLVDFKEETLQNKISDFKRIETAYKAKEIFNITDTRDWNIDEALEKIKKNDIFIEEYNYRPFDNRFVCYNDELVERRRFNIMKHLLKKENKSLIIGRAGQNVATGMWNLSFISDKISDANIFYRGGGTVFPLYLYEKIRENIFKEEEPDKAISKYEKQLEFHKEEFKKNVLNLKRHEDLFALYKQAKPEDIDIIEECRSVFEEQKTTYEKIKKYYSELIKNSHIKIKDNKQNNVEFLETGIVKRPNFTDNFLKFIKQKYPDYTPEKILGYIYAILHSPTYRNKYADFLKIDFPKIPFCESNKIFEKLSVIGTELINCHLLKKNLQKGQYKKIGAYCGEGDDVVLKPVHKTIKTDDKTQECLYINKNQYFENIPIEVYDFYIGGYQVLYKYLKYRKGKKIQLNDVLTIAKISKTLSYTIEQMKLIDNETNKWI